MASVSKNPNKHTKNDAPKPKMLAGRKVLYLGNGVNMVCPACGLKRSKGMVSEVGGVYYCSETCARTGSSAR
jgi:hypothetical protein